VKKGIGFVPESGGGVTRLRSGCRLFGPRLLG
jgi:hypothetical protein